MKTVFCHRDLGDHREHDLCGLDSYRTILDLTVGLYGFQSEIARPRRQTFENKGYNQSDNALFLAGIRITSKIDPFRVLDSVSSVNSVAEEFCSVSLTLFALTMGPQ